MKPPIAGLQSSQERAAERGHVDEVPDPNLELMGVHQTTTEKTPTREMKPPQSARVVRQPARRSVKDEPKQLQPLCADSFDMNSHIVFLTGGGKEIKHCFAVTGSSADGENIVGIDPQRSTSRRITVAVATAHARYRSRRRHSSLTPGSQQPRARSAVRKTSPWG